ncbi:putative peptidase [Pseudobythopirellula maris]|uniref:Putative peptidase n=1 Tax=Pseudobythopirellula maris TaxID=2527991 RepID=A0A5C5ZJL7_9BACT|nr:Xaa-Pro peptidase family protein [Pseudobythopirellula maris]TWT87569.1 putative peptidase [Pseudobythopirellula maris]
MADIEIDLQACRDRQQRLVAEMQRLSCDLCVLTRMESVQWLTGARVGPLFSPTASIDLDGRVTLVLPGRKVDTPAAADQVVGYEEKRLSTMCDANEQVQASLDALFSHFVGAPEKIGCEFTSAPMKLSSVGSGEWLDIDALMFRLRRKKDAYELALMARANEANRAMYERAREIIEPGLSELDLYSELHRVAVAELGETLTYFGQDFRANARGGAPRNRKAQAGELWILDLGVGLRGYHTDNARTIAVSEPTDEQQQAWDEIAAVFPMIEQRVKPGVSCREVFDESKQMLAPAEPWLFNHHLGHGVGLAPHEGPHLNPNWDDTFEPGDYFTAEPGLYHEDLKHGIRLEQNYVVTETGVELLTDWPLGLK